MTWVEICIVFILERVPKRRFLKLRRRGITQKKTYYKSKVVPAHVMRTHMGSRGTAPLILNLDTKMETKPVPTEQAGWVPGSVWAFWTTDKADSVRVT